MIEREVLTGFLLTEMSRRNTDLVADLIYQKPELFGELFHLFCQNSEPVSRRAAWVLDTVSERIPELILPYLDRITELLPSFSHDGLKRHSLHILARSPLPAEPQLGLLIKTCFEWLLSANEATAAKVSCMEILYRISESEPDIKRELADSIGWRMEEETPGFKNHGLKLLKKLNLELSQH